MALQTKIVLSVVSRKAMQGLGLFWRTLKGVTGTIFSMRSALLALGGAAGFGFLVKRSLNATDALAKTASKIGTTTEALSKLQYAAQITGVEQNTLNMALQRFTRRAAEAAQGTGEAKGALRELGVDANKLQKIPLDQQMAVLADAFGKVQTESDKLRLAFKLFDSEGAALVNTLALGRDGLEKLFGRAQALGIVMSADAAAGVEKANDAITDLLALGRGLTNQFVAAIAPAIEHLAGKLTDLTLESVKADGGMVKFAQGLAINFINGIRTALGALDVFLGSLTNVGRSVSTFFDRFEQKAQADRIEYLHNKLLELYDTKLLIQKGEQGILDYMTYGRGKEGAANVQKDIEEVSAKLLKLQHAASQAQEASANLGEGLGGLIDMEGINKLFDELVANIEKMGTEVPKNLKPATDSVNAFENGIKKWGDSLVTIEQQITSITENAMNGLTTAIREGITGTKSFADAFRSMAANIVSALLDMAIQYYIVKPLFDAFVGGTTGSFNPQPTAPVSGGYSRPMSPRAIGGSVQAGQPYMVGERGMEMFVPNQSGAIIPNDRLGGGAGVVINQTINLSAGVSQTVRAEVQSMMPQIANAAKSAVADARQRGGGFSNAIIGA